MIYGMFVIDNLTESRTEFFADGKARRIEFTLSLRRVSEHLIQINIYHHLIDIIINYWINGVKYGENWLYQGVNK